MNQPQPISPSTLRLLSQIEGVRHDVLAKIRDLTEEEAMRIPEGHRNSIHWNVGHMLHVQLSHWFVRRDLPIPVDIPLRNYFADGKSPLNYDSATPIYATLLGLYEQYSIDLAGKFGDFMEAPLTKPFDYLNSHYATIADDLHLLLFHEGEHYPMFRRLLKSLGKV